MPLLVTHRVGARALAEVGAAFDGLADQERLPVTARRLWLQSWIDAYPDWQPWLVLVEGGDELLAAAPLARRRRKGLLEVALVGDGPTDDARLPARTEAAAEKLAEGIVTGLPRRGPWRLRLSQVPPGDPVVGALMARLPHASARAVEGMPLVEISEGAVPDQYLSRNAKKSLAKVRNRIRDRGLEVDVRWTTDADHIVDLLPDLMRVHRERDVALGRRPDHDDPRAATFYREVLTRHARAGQVDLLTLCLDGDLAAFVAGFRDGRTLRSWDNRLSPRWADVSAGRLANSEALRHVVTSSAYDALDWMRGEEPYKLQTATRVVPSGEVRAWSSRTVRWGEDMVDLARDSARAAMQRSTWLRSAVQRARTAR